MLKRFLQNVRELPLATLHLFLHVWMDRPRQRLRRRQYFRSEPFAYKHKSFAHLFCARPLQDNINNRYIFFAKKI